MEALDRNGDSKKASLMIGSIVKTSPGL